MSDKEYTVDFGYDDDFTNRVAMKDLFNMTAGTSTGSIIAAGLAYPSKVSANNAILSAEGLLEIYSTKGKDIFLKNEMSTFAITFWFIIIFSAFSFIGYAVGEYWYDNFDTRAALEDLKYKMSNARRKLKKHMQGQEDKHDVDQAVQ